MKKKIGIIGFGEMGKRHGLEFWESSKGRIEISGVIEPDDSMYLRGCEWNHRDNIPRYSTISELLEKGKPDGIIISSPNFTHLENLKQLKGLNIPILLEKPLDTSLEKVAEIVRFSREYAGPIVVDHVMRYAPIIRKARELIESNRLGKICSFQFSQRLGIGMFHTFRRTKAGGGGHIIEKATHDLDVMLYLTGAKPLSASMVSKQQVVGGNLPDDLTCPECPNLLSCRYANAGTSVSNSRFKDIATHNSLCVFAKSVDIPDNEVCTILLSRNIFGTYSHAYFCRMHGHTRDYEVIGTEGALTIKLAKEDRYAGEIELFPYDERNTVEKYDFEYCSKIHYYGGPFVVKHFYNLMCGLESKPFTTVEQAFTAELLGFAAMKSAEENSRFVELDEVVPPDLRDAIQGES